MSTNKSSWILIPVKVDSNPKNMEVETVYNPNLTIDECTKRLREQHGGFESEVEAGFVSLKSNKYITYIIMKYLIPLIGELTYSTDKVAVKAIMAALKKIV